MSSLKELPHVSEPESDGVEERDRSSVRLRRHVRRGVVYVPLSESKLSAKAQAEWDAAEAERQARTIRK